MTPPPLIGPDGHAIALGALIATGGEGAVYNLRDDPSRVAKIYHKPPSKQTADKLAAMTGLAGPKLLAVAAWPSGLLRDAKTRAAVGFVMPRVSDCEPVQQLYNPVQRLKNFPQANWSFQIRAAANLAAAFDEVHTNGCLVGDINQSNALVSRQALARLIDCDSFQVRAGNKHYLCEVGVPLYTPPELQGKSFRGLTRTANHDRFGLAVLIYQLLFVGRHPYMGIYSGPGDPSFEQLITEYRFAQGPQASNWGMAPPPHTPTFADIPPAVAGLFRRAFERGGELGTRPRADEWITALAKLEAETVECAADPGHRYWRGAGKCVWCRLAERGGPEYYFGVAGGGSGFAVDEAKLEEVLRRLAATLPAAFRLDRDRFRPTKPPVPKPPPPNLTEHRFNAMLVGGAAVLCLVLIPVGLVLWPIGFVASLGAAIFGAWVVWILKNSPLQREKKRRRSALRDALADLRDVEADWRGRVADYTRDFDRAGKRVRDQVADCRALAGRYRDELKRLAGNAEVNAKLRHLRLHQLADAEIPKIGPGRVQTLAAHGIATAADVDAARIRAIKGFGDALTGNVVAWRDGVLRQFRFDRSRAVPATEQRVVTAQMRTEQQRMLAALDQQFTKLDALTPACRAALGRLEPQFRTAESAYAQAEADLNILAAYRT